MHSILGWCIAISGTSSELKTHEAVITLLHVADAGRELQATLARILLVSARNDVNL